jgi:hypothetical protein
MAGDSFRLLAMMVALLVLMAARVSFAQSRELLKDYQWTPPAIALPSPLKHPVIAATPEELARLRAAWKTTGAEHDVLEARFAKVDDAIRTGLVFPPEGGQHNQWYQCEICQVALKTIDAHHHQCPKCGRIYSGFPYDNVLYSKQHSDNCYRCEDAAWAWAVTGEKKYADFAAAVLDGYADRYLNYPMVCNSVNDKSIDVGAGKLTKYRSAGHMVEQTLGEAMLLIPLSDAYDLIYDSGALSADQKKHVEAGLLRPMAECIDVYKAGKSNWQTWHNAALLYAGAVMGDEALVKQSILEPKNGFVFQMRESVLPEGMWYENSWGYHYYTLVALTHMAEGTRRLGIDIYSNPMLKKMYLLAFDYRMSDGSLPRFGDAVQDTPMRPSVNEMAYAVYKDPRLLSSLPAKPSFDSIELGRDVSKVPPEFPQGRSKLFAGAGHAILLTDGPGKLSAAMTFGPYGGFHGHFDKLSFVFFGYGEELAVDPGRAASQAYRLPIHTDWYKSTTGHNAVLVDGKGQKEADGKLISFGANDSYAAVAADAGQAFANVDHKRLLVLTPTYLLVVDQLQSTDGKEHTFDWVYHNMGRVTACKLPEGNAKLGDNPGYAYLADVKSYVADPAALTRATITAGQADVHLAMLQQPGDQIFAGTGPVKSVDDRAAAFMVRRVGASVTFVTVLEPEKTGGSSAIKSIAQLDRSSGWSIQRDSGRDTVRDSGSFGEKVQVSSGTGDDEAKPVLPFTQNGQQ